MNRFVIATLFFTAALAAPCKAQGWVPGMYLGAAGGTAFYSGEAAPQFEVPGELSAASFELGYQFRQGGAVALRLGYQSFNAFDTLPDDFNEVGRDPVYVLTDPDWFSATLLVRGGSDQPRTFYPFVELGGTFLVTSATDDKRFGRRGSQVAFGPQMGFGFALNVEEALQLTLTASAAALFPDDTFDTTFDPSGNFAAEPDEVEGGASDFIFDFAGSIQVGVRYYL